MHAITKHRSAAPILALAAVMAVGGAFAVRSTFAATAAKPAAAAIGQPAPSFELSDQDGKTVSLADYKDRTVVLEWFNDGCPFVQKWYSKGDMNKVAADAMAKGVVWLSVNSTSNADVAHNKQVAGKWNILHPVLDDHDGTVGHLYGAKTTPNLFIIDKGTLVYAGAIDSVRSTEQEDVAKGENYVTKALAEIAAGKAVSTPQTEPYGCSVKYKS